MRWRTVAIVIQLLFLTAGEARQTPPASASAADNGNVVFSVSQTLIQVDAEVTDGIGRHITDLKSDDFAVLLDHKPQQITSVIYVPLNAADINKPALGGKGPVPSFIVKPQDVHRSTVLLVDTLGLSAQSVLFTKRGLHQFLNKNMRPGDLFALWETGHYNSVFQQFTSDKHLLDAAIDALKWNPNGTGLLSAFEEENRGNQPPGAVRARVGAQMGQGEQDEQLYLRAGLSANVFTIMNELVEELRQVGGRKAIVLFSDGIDIGAVPDVNGAMNPGLPEQANALKQERELIDNANRSGAVLYAIDMRGLEELGEGTGRKLFGGQAGLQQLTEPTGGFAVINSNGYADALEQIEDDQKGYYLIAFKANAQIDTAQMKSTAFLPLQVRVKRRGLKVRSRKGFWGETDEAANRKTTPDQEMRLALRSLFNRSDIGVRLTALYARTSEGKPAVRNLIYLNANDLKFSDEPNGKHKALLNIIVTASGAGIGLTNLGRHLEVNATDEQLKALLYDGVLLHLDVPISRPGAYQVRASVEDTFAKRIGSAGQYLDVPDLKKRHLALTTPLIDSTDATAEGRFHDVSAALREFRAGTELTFVSVIETDRDDAFRGNLEGAVALFHDGEPLSNTPIPIVAVQGERVHALKGRLKLKDSLAPGQYYLRAEATERTGKHSRSTAAWIDFEVLPAAGPAAPPVQ